MKNLKETEISSIIDNNKVSQMYGAESRLQWAERDGE